MAIAVNTMKLTTNSLWKACACSSVSPVKDSDIDLTSRSASRPVTAQIPRGGDGRDQDHDPFPSPGPLANQRTKLADSGHEGERHVGIRHGPGHFEYRHVGRRARGHVAPAARQQPAGPRGYCDHQEDRE